MAAKTLEKGSKYETFDTDGDGVVSDNELKQAEEVNRIEFALFGMLLYPASVVLASWIGLPTAGDILGNMAPTYFVSVAAIVAAFYGSQAYVSK